jgi:acetyl-CoA synthetase
VLPLSDPQAEALALMAHSYRVDPPHPPSGRLPVTTPEAFRDLYRRSVEDPAAYWAEVARELTWFRDWDKTLEGHFPEFRWFVGGESNVSMNCIDRHLPERGNRPALIHVQEEGGERVWTWQEFHQATARFAQALSEMGVHTGDTVAIFLPNLLETFAATHACYRIGAVYNIIFSGFSAEALLDRLMDTQPKVVVTADEALRRGRTIPLKRTLDRVVDRVSSVRHVVVVRRTGSAVPMKEGRDRYWDEVMATTEGEHVPVPLEANAPGFIIVTSGTTSKPKGLVHAGLGFLVGAYHNVKWALDLGPDDVYWCTADVGWLTFPIFELVGGLPFGATYVLYDGALDYPEPDRVYSIIERYRVSKVFTAPTALRMLARHGVAWRERHDLTSLRLISLVGEPLDGATWEWVFREMGQGRVEINNTYGQSETGSAWTSSAVGVTPARPGSCGMPLPGHAYAVVDEAGRPLPPGRVGQLVLTHPFPTLARTIWNDADRYRREYFQMPGLYSTYDSAVVDTDGHVWVLGRLDDVINVAAHRLSTMEMESAVLRVDEVAEAAVVGVPDPIKGQVPVVFVTLRAGAAVTDDLPSRVQEHLAAAIGPIARPAAVHVVQAMPKTRSGKIVRRLLRDLLVEGRVRGDMTGLEDPEIVDRLRAELHPPGAEPSA